MLMRVSMRVVRLVICAVVVAGLSNHASAGVIVNPGFDLLFTKKAQFDFMGMGGLNVVDFKGVPLGTFDFGLPHGIHNVGATDTILHRKNAVNLPDFPPLNPPIPIPPEMVVPNVSIEIVALSLVTVNPINWSGFGGIANEFVRTVLVQDDGSTMTIYNDMTFDSNLMFQLRLQGMDSLALSPILPVNFTQMGATWTHDPASQSVLIDDVNYKLNGSDTTTDFFTGVAKHGPDHIHITVDINAVPEPSSLALLGLGLIGFGVAHGSRRRRQTTMESAASATNKAC